MGEESDSTDMKGHRVAVERCPVLTSMSSGSRVTLCMGRMRKEIMGKFRQSACASMRASASLNAALVALGR